MIELLADNYKHCPICKKECRVEAYEGYHYGYYAALQVQVFLCFNPLADDPLHYYNHIVASDDTLKIARQEFSLNLGNRYVIFINNYKEQTSSIKFHKNDNATLLPVMLMPDFPKLTSLKSKVRTIIVFS